MTGAPDNDRMVEVSVVMPCLNEADTLAFCIEAAAGAMARAGIDGEIVVADNGSSDGSREIARRLGARVVDVPERGYGRALQAGIAAARGRFVVMGDADASYDFGEIARLVEPLRAGHDLAQGCRLSSGGGRIEKGAMPWLHRWIGNPVLSWIARIWFRSSVHDVYCGLRAFRRDFVQSLGLRSPGMEYATEMIVRSSLHGASIAEVPITLHPDRRKAHRPHLRTFRDGWRTLRFFLLYSPRWLFLLPGLALCAAGLLGYAFVMPGLRIGHVRFDVHTLLVASLAILCGFQAVLFAVFTRLIAARDGWLGENPRLTQALRSFSIERGLLAGFFAVVLGVAFLVKATLDWKSGGFGDLDYARTMRVVIPGVTLTALGVQAVFGSFFVGILRVAKE